MTTQSRDNYLQPPAIGEFPGTLCTNEANERYEVSYFISSVGSPPYESIVLSSLFSPSYLNHPSVWRVTRNLPSQAPRLLSPVQRGTGAYQHGPPKSTSRVATQSSSCRALSRIWRMVSFGSTNMMWMNLRNGYRARPITASTKNLSRVGKSAALHIIGDCGTAAVGLAGPHESVNGNAVLGYTTAYDDRNE